MSKARNKVIAGDFINRPVKVSFGSVTIDTGFFNSITLNKTTVESYELITDSHKKSASSSAMRGLVGGFLLGPAGLIAGGVTGKTKDIYNVAINFTDGKRSLLEIDQKIYNTIIKNNF